MGFFILRGDGMQRVRLSLEDTEYTALSRMADKELRGVSDQARHIVRRELERQGLLKTQKQEAADAS